ncbi:MAG: hypothetical protein E7604_08325 [Ruminococcaceae bacterium]|nr:hypothetical protein [Oscillospiraceae bacterium]
MIKLATYNLWNHPAGLPHRQVQITDTLSALGADILCLQEDFLGESLLPQLTSCMYHAHHAEMDLSVLSRYPITEHHSLPYALAVQIVCDSHSLSLFNVHLPWDSAGKREQAIIDITGAAGTIDADYTLIAGDFNCSDNSAVQRFLCGEQSLHGRDAYYFDLAEAYAEQSGIPAPPTLDFRRNPRWGIAEPPNTLEKNQRFDRILLANPYPKPAPMLTEAGIFGMEISKISHLAPSDHWGVYACLSF